MKNKVPENAEFCVIEVEFVGNHAKQYEYFCEIPLDTKGKEIDVLSAHAGDICVVPTNDSFSVGKIVKVKNFSERSDLCSKVCFEHWKPGVAKFYLDNAKAAVEMKRDLEVMELLR